MAEKEFIGFSRCLWQDVSFNSNLHSSFLCSICLAGVTSLQFFNNQYYLLKKPPNCKRIWSRHNMKLYLIINTYYYIMGNLPHNLLLFRPFFGRSDPLPFFLKKSLCPWFSVGFLRCGCLKINFWGEMLLQVFRLSNFMNLWMQMGEDILVQQEHLWFPLRTSDSSHSHRIMLLTCSACPKDFTASHMEREMVWEMQQDTGKKLRSWHIEHKSGSVQHFMGTRGKWKGRRQEEAVH